MYTERSWYFCHIPLRVWCGVHNNWRHHRKKKKKREKKEKNFALESCSSTTDWGCLASVSKHGVTRLSHITLTTGFLVLILSEDSLSSGLIHDTLAHLQSLIQPLRAHFGMILQPGRREIYITSGFTRPSSLVQPTHAQLGWHFALFLGLCDGFVMAWT